MIVFFLNVIGLISSRSLNSTNETQPRLVKVKFDIIFHKYILIFFIKSSIPFSNWLNSTTNLRRIYLFDVLNANDILRGVKASFKQRGPYTYREVVQKRNLKYLNQTHISYDLVRNYYFEANLSVGNENDTVTFLNLPAMVTSLPSINFI